MEGGTTMKPVSIAHQPHILPGHGQAVDQFNAWAGRMVSVFQQALTKHKDQEPTIEHIVDRIMATASGGCCEVKLNPRITRVDNLKWLLPICVQQFGTTIAISEHTEGDQMILAIQVTARKQKTPGQSAQSGEQDVVTRDLPLEVAL
jgi:hypothetical protein